MRRLYGLPCRVAYIIGTKVLRHILSSQMNPTKHVDEAVRAFKLVIEEGGFLELWRPGNLKRDPTIFD